MSRTYDRKGLERDIIAAARPLFDRLHPQIQAQVRDHLDLERTEQEAML